MPLNIFKNPSKEPKYSQEIAKKVSDPFTKKEANRYQDLVVKRKTQPQQENKVESVFGNKGGYLKHKDLLEKSGKYHGGFSFKEKGNIEHSGHYKYEKNAREQALNSFKERFLKGKEAYTEKDVKDGLRQLEKENRASYFPGSSQDRKASIEREDFIKDFYGLKEKQNASVAKNQGFFSWLTSGGK